MNNREKLPQEKLHEKIQILMPDAKFSVRPKADSRLDKNPAMRGEFSVDWDESNKSPCPTTKEIEAVTDKQIKDKEKQQVKADRDKKAGDNLALKGLLRIEQRLNPALTMSEYLDSLESEVV